MVIYGKQLISKDLTHELMHAVHMTEEMFNRFVYEHPASSVNKPIEKQIEKISEQLADLYQMIGEEHFSDDNKDEGIPF